MRELQRRCRGLSTTQGDTARKLLKSLHGHHLLRSQLPQLPPPPFRRTPDQATVFQGGAHCFKAWCTVSSPNESPRRRGTRCTYTRATGWPAAGPPKTAMLHAVVWWKRSKSDCAVRVVSNKSWSSVSSKFARRATQRGTTTMCPGAIATTRLKATDNPPGEAGNTRPAPLLNDPRRSSSSTRGLSLLPAPSAFHGPRSSTACLPGNTRT